MRSASERGVHCYERVIRSTTRRMLSRVALREGRASWKDLFNREGAEVATALEVVQEVYRTIMPINGPGQIVVTDSYARRWLATVLAESDEIFEQARLIYSLLPPPDLSLFLTVATETAYQRIMARGKGDHILREGGLERLTALARGFELLQGSISYNTTTVSNDGTPEQCLAQVDSALRDAARAIGDELIAAKW